MGLGDPTVDLGRGYAAMTKENLDHRQRHACFHHTDTRGVSHAVGRVAVKAEQVRVFLLRNIDILVVDILYAIIILDFLPVCFYPTIHQENNL